MCLDAPGGDQEEDCRCSSQGNHQIHQEMNKKTTFLVNALLILACVFLFGFLIGLKHPQKSPVEPIKMKVDTLVIHDTTMSYKPIYVDMVKLDSVLVPVLDTMMIHDTTFIYLEREKVTWRDSLCEVYASGIMVSVDSVRHFQEHKYITIETQVPVKVKSHWGLGINAGYGVGKGGLTPYVGVGISYNLLSW